MESVKLGIIGCGKMGSRHAGVGRDSDLIELTAVADIREEAAKDLAEKMGASGVYTDAKDLINDENVEAVIIAMPACARTAIALDAFAAGKHVLTEKPVAMNADEVRQMIEAKGDLIGACLSMRTRFTASSKFVQEYLSKKPLGDLRVVRVKAFQGLGPKPETPGPEWRLKKALNAGGIMSNWGCYDLDYMLGLTGWSLEPEVVLGQIWEIAPDFTEWIAPGSDAETHVAALIRCKGGIVLTLERGEFVAGATQGAWEITGTKGTLRLVMPAGQDQQIIHENTSPEEGVVSSVLWEGDTDWKDTTVGPVENFVQAIRGECEVSTSLEKALVIQRITDAIYKSSETGDAVDFNSV